VTSDDAEVKRLVGRAVERVGDDKTARAEAMRRFVHSYIRSKSLGVGFASAAEVARTRTGDCTEHAVLLAAMLRADGIASRVVSGVIYAEEFEGQRNVFGYHMWTQANVGPTYWMNLDPTLPPGAAFDATHIALATSALEDGETTNALVSLVPLLGNLRISVEKVEY
jgi:transglutaminase-like putative cysteine protease